jgi:threonine/homoserine/homoserine lactone efflux protein
LAARVCYESAVPDPALYAVFLVAAVALLAVPRPAVLYVVSQSIGGLAGRLRGSRRAVSAGRRVSGGILVALGVTATLAGPRRSA